MSKYILTFCFIGLSHFTWSQDLLLKGKIMDINNLPISMAHVHWQNQKQGTVSDADGNYLLAKTGADSLIISAIGYKTLVIANNKIANRIFLKEEIYLLKEIAVVPGEYREVELGFLQEDLFKDSLVNFKNNYSLEHFENVTFIKNPSQNIGQLQSVNFYIGAIGKYQTPFRIHIYSVDSITGNPDKELLTKELIVQSDVKDDWFKVSLKDLNIEFPSEGCFVSMEWFHSKKYKKYLYKVKREFTLRGKTFKTLDHSYGQTLGIYRAPKKKARYSKFNRSEWRKYDSVFDPMIKITALIYDNHAIKN